MKVIYECQYCGKTSDNKNLIENCERNHLVDAEDYTDDVIDAIAEVEDMIHYVHEEFGDKGDELLMQKLTKHMESAMAEMATKAQTETTKSKVKPPVYRDYPTMSDDDFAQLLADILK